MQPTLFAPKVLNQLKTRKVYGLDDVFPFGSWKGKKLSVVAAINPGHLEWWIRTKHVAVTEELKSAINLSKYLSK